ncbi:MAG TPA: hypothetical protein DD727_08840 [Clostridiales bacterium]|nr:hypothetical protein [Clostridiales bacterium]
MQIQQLNEGNCLTYLIRGEGMKEVILVDPVIDEADGYINMIKNEGMILTFIIDTHSHADHISAAGRLIDATGCRYIMHRDAAPACVTDRVEDGAELTLNGIIFRFLHTPGHTKDSLSVWAGHCLFTGDFLFLEDGGAGRDDLPGGDPGTHWESFQKLKELPEDLLVLPAHEYHGRKPSSLKNQYALNPFLQYRDKGAFIRMLEELKLGPADWMKDVLEANYSCTRDPHAAYIPKDMPACEVGGTREPEPGTQGVAEITPAGLYEWMEMKKEILLLDVREPAELTAPPGRIEGVVNIPLGVLGMRTGEISKYRDKPAVIICRSGGRASVAAKLLEREGFSRLYVMKGGMLNWKNGTGT